MLTSLGVFTVEEMQSRTEIMLENYCKSVVIEANTMVSMTKTQILPAIESFAADTAMAASAKKALVSGLSCAYETGLVEKLSALADEICQKTMKLEEEIAGLEKAKDIIQESALIRDTVLPAMEGLRIPCDQAELLVAKSYWPFPTYADLLFSVK